MTDTTALTLTEGAGSIKLEWAKQTVATQGYEILRRETLSPFSPYTVIAQTHDADAVGFTDYSATVGTSYNYYVRPAQSLGTDTDVQVGSPQTVVPAGELTYGGQLFCATATTGSVSCWGENVNDTTLSGNSTESTVYTLPSVALKRVRLSSGNLCGIDITTDNFYCQGWNGYGQLGVDPGTMSSGSATGSMARLAVPGGYAVCILDRVGDVYCQGYNNYGQLGDGTTTDRITLQKVQGFSGGVDLIDYGTGFCALDTLGRIFCWGGVTDFFTGATTPTQIPFTLRIQNMSAADGTLCVVTTDQDVYCRGGNERGRLGVGLGDSSTWPWPTLPGWNDVGVTQATSVTVTQQEVCATRSNGQLYCWGNNGFEGLYYNAKNLRLEVNPSEQMISGYTNGFVMCSLFNAEVACSFDPWSAQSIDSSSFNVINKFHDSTFLSLEPPTLPTGLNATVGRERVKLSWNRVRGANLGYRVERKLASDPDIDGSYTQVATLSRSRYTAYVDYSVTAGTAYTYRIRAESTAGLTTPSSTVDATPLGTGPYLVNRLTLLTDGYGYVVTPDRQLARWGGGGPTILSSGVFGVSQQQSGVLTLSETGSLPDLGITNEATNVEDIQGTLGQPSCALLAHGDIYCESNFNFTPVAGDVFSKVLLWQNIKAFRLNGYAICAIQSDDTVQCAGIRGNLGDGVGPGANNPIPQNVIGVSGAVQLTSGSQHFCALLNTGAVKCWGGNWMGQLGDGTGVDRVIPVQVQGISTAIGLTSFGDMNCATLQDLSVKCWGRNIGASLTEEINGATPVPVTTSRFQAYEQGAWLNASETFCKLDADRVACGGNSSSGSPALGLILASGTSWIDQYSPPAAVGVTPLSPPATVTATADIEYVRVSWAQVAGADQGYEIYRRLDSDPETAGSYSLVKTVLSSSFTAFRDYDVSVGVGYRYQVVAKGLKGSSAASATSNLAVPTARITIDPKIVGGVGSFCNLDNGWVYCSGDNGGGALADPGFSGGFRPYRSIAVPDSLIDLVSGEQGFCGITDTRDVQCWGYENSFGAIGSTPQSMGVTDTVYLNLGSDRCRVKKNGVAQCGTVSSGEPALPDFGSVKQVFSTGSGGGSCVLLEHGDVYCLGTNFQGSVTPGVTGMGVYTRVWIPPIQSLATGVMGNFTLAVATNGEVYSWGNGDQPEKISGITTAVDASVLWDHWCVRLSSGDLRCGYEYRGTPFNPGFTGVEAYSLSYPSGWPTSGAFSMNLCAMENNGVTHLRTTRCWIPTREDDGTLNSKGPMGTGHTWVANRNGLNAVDFSVAFSLPATVTGLQAATDSDGQTVLTWNPDPLALQGYEVYWKSSVDPDSSYTLLGTLPGKDLISDRSFTAFRNVLGTAGSYTYRVYGRNRLGVSATPAVVTATKTSYVPLNGGHRKVVTGDQHTCVLDTDQRVRCWGRNDYGQVGNGTFTDQSAPAGGGGGIGGLSDVVDIAAFENTTCAVTLSQAVYCWGRVTTSSVNDYDSPTQLYTLSSLPLQISMSQGYVCVLLANGRITCYGSEYLGDGFYPGGFRSDIEVRGVGGVARLEGGYFLTCAVTADGNNFCWGENYNQMISATPSGVNFVRWPVWVSDSVSTLRNTLAVSYQALCSLSTLSGTFLCNPTSAFGHNAAVDRLFSGNSNSAGTNTPQCAVSSGNLACNDLTQNSGNIDSAAIGSGHKCYLTTSGNVYCWGSNYKGQLGDGTGVDSASPVLAY